MFTFLSLLRRFAQPDRMNRRPSRPRPTIRPRLESLEERAVPAVLVAFKGTDDGSFGTLRYAINHAGNGDTIYCVVAQLHNEVDLTQGDIEISKNLTIETPVTSLTPTTINGGALNRPSTPSATPAFGNFAGGLFYVDPGVQVTFKNLILTGGSAVIGGAIYNAGGAVTVSNVTLTQNTADAGGAIYNSGPGESLSLVKAGVHPASLGVSGTVELDGSTLSNNFAYYAGGAIYNAGGQSIGGSPVKTVGVVAPGTVTINGGTLSGNSTYYGFIYDNDGGGAIYNYGGTLVVNGAKLTGNTAGANGYYYYYDTAGQGGAINNFNGSVTIQNGSTLSLNTANGGLFLGGEGGAIYNGGEGGVTIDGSTLSNNTAQKAAYPYYASGGEGGAIFNGGEGGVFIQHGSTLSGNTAQGFVFQGPQINAVKTSNTQVQLVGGEGGEGGAIFNNEGGFVFISASKVTGNQATGTFGAGGGVFNIADYTFSLVVTSHSSITGNTATFGPDLAAYSGTFSISSDSTLGTLPYLL